MAARTVHWQALNGELFCALQEVQVLVAGTALSEKSFFAERTTQQEFIPATHNERPFAREQLPPALLTGQLFLAPGRDSAGEQVLEVALVHLMLRERLALRLRARPQSKPRPQRNEVSQSSTTNHRSRLPLTNMAVTSCLGRCPFKQRPLASLESEAPRFGRQVMSSQSVRGPRHCMSPSPQQRTAASCRALTRRRPQTGSSTVPRGYKRQLQYVHGCLNAA
jgi:hypothetical protein